MPDAPTTDQELAEAQAVEYGTYVATQPINIGGARAFNVGDPVPVSHVKRKVVPADAVAKKDTKAAKAAAEENTPTGSEA